MELSKYVYINISWTIYAIKIIFSQLGQLCQYFLSHKFNDDVLNINRVIIKGVELSRYDYINISWTTYAIKIIFSQLGQECQRECVGGVKVKVKVKVKVI